MAKIDEGVAAPVSGGAARLRFFSMKRTVSQQSFDGVSLDNSGPEDRISVDSDGSESFVMLLESGRWKQAGRVVELREGSSCCCIQTIRVRRSRDRPFFFLFRALRSQARG